MADRPVQFGPKAAKQIIDTVIRVNREPYQSPRQGTRYPIISGGTIPQLGVTNGTVTAKG